MKKQTLRDLHQKEIKELEDLLTKAENDLVKMKMEMAIGKIKNVHKVARKNDEIAVIMTILNQKTIAMKAVGKGMK